jgi:uncharacterized protein
MYICFMPSTTELIKRHTSLSANIVAFCRFLRTKEFKIAPPEEADALQTIEILQPFYAPALMRDALKIILTRSQEQADRFDELYDYYWKQVEKATDSKKAEQANDAPNPKPPQSKEDAQFQSLKDWLFGNKQNEEELDLYTYSAAEALTKKDFSTMTEEELKEVYELIQMIARRLARQRNRRFKKNKNGGLDLRKTLRQNMRRGGDMLEIIRKNKQKRRIKLVLLCDVSKSMELYSRFMVQFSYSFQQVFKHIDTFVFSTKLAKITEILRGGNFNDILKNLSENVPNWSGGTRIGESFMDFITHYGDKCLTSRTIVFIISDGWDTGNLEALETAMKIFHKKAEKVIWLNPLASNPSYEVSTEGMKLALPYIDVFAAGHNVESLRKVVGRL